jgi:hypothetical protein
MACSKSGPSVCGIGLALFERRIKPYIPRKLNFWIFTMPQPMEFRIRRPGLKGWLIILVSVSVVIAIAVAIAVVAVGVFLFLLPLLVIAAALYYLFGRTTFRRRYRQGRTPVIIDGEFRRVNPSDMERTRRQD